MAITNMEEFRNSMNEVNNPETTQDVRSKLGQDILEFVSAKDKTVQDNEVLIAKNKERIEELVVANGDLFSKVGFQNASKKEKEKEVEKERSETITLNDLLGG
jgi:hypothetical protein